MKNLLYQKWFKPAIIGVLTLLSVYNLQNQVSLESNPVIDYDQKMWTSSSITTFYMLFTDYVRPTEKLDPWFESYAKKHGINPEDLSDEEKQWYAADIWTFGWKAPNIGKIIMGSSILLGADTSIEKAGYFNQWYKPELNLGQGAEPPTSFILLARIPNAIMTFGSIALVFFIGYRFFNFWVAVIAALYLILNPIFLKVNTIAGLDAPSIFFSTLSITFVFLMFETLNDKKSFKRILVYGLGIGIAFPLAVGSKLNAALAGYVMLVIFGIYAITLLLNYFKAPAKLTKTNAQLPIKKDYLQLMGKLLLTGGMIGALTYSIFVGFNPIFRQDIGKKATIVQESVDAFFERRARSKKTSKMKDDFKKSFELVFKRNFIKVEEKYNGTIGKLLPFSPNPLDGLIYYLGLIVLLFKAFKELIANNKVAAAAILCTWSLIFIWGNTDFMWTDFTRYHMPFYPSTALIIGFGIWAIFNYFLGISKPKKIDQIAGTV